MSQFASRASRRRSRLLVLAAFSIVALLLGGCGFTDERGTEYHIVVTSADHPEGESLAGIGALLVGESARVTFEVTPIDRPTVDRTAAAVISLTNQEPDDDVDDFVFLLSTDLAAQPYHTLVSFVPEAKATLCATYAGPEVPTAEPVETCMRVMTIEPAE